MRQEDIVEQIHWVVLGDFSPDAQVASQRRSASAVSLQHSCKQPALHATFHSVRPAVDVRV